MNNPYLIIGDSHVSVFTNDNLGSGSITKDDITSVHLGPYTSFGIWREKDTDGPYFTGLGNGALDVANDNPNCIIGFVFGEIDCRIHIPKHLKEYSGIEEAVRISQSPLIKLYDSIEKSERLLIGMHVSLHPEDNVWVYGSDDLRKEIAKEWNRQLAEYGTNKNIPMINFMDLTSSLPDPSYIYLDTIHLLHSKCYGWIRFKLKDLFKNII